MKQQIVVIHGADSYAKYEDYIESLKQSAVWNTIENFGRKDWKTNLQNDLGDEYQVILPKMPNKNNARYLEWKIWMDGFFDQIDKDAIWIGHSMGGIFLAKYLTEKALICKAIILVAAPFEDFDKESLVDFNFETKDFVKNIKAEKVTLYHSTDDPVVPYSHSEMYHARIPNSKVTILKNRGHINQDVFPEIVQEILSS